ncbi:MFS general substrate transporter [Choiromyces venosus 120613-1]|uniref:MFS general substrate transporter n=1 Tax=Choiromyces venosus 120613-1 TaxID=1336337 RepID=A0A3N4JN25_9PEZI|nr:MFS general substrate transporter [Choiromyces venosus 120613-1]
MNYSVTSSDESAPQWKPSKRLNVVFMTMCLISPAAALDATSISVALPIMSKKLNGTAAEAFWTGTSFLLTSTVFQPIFSALSDIFGRKPLILTALTFFTTGAVVCGLADNFTVILAGRSIQGMGGGGMLVLNQIVRGKYLGFLAMMWALGSVSVPVVGSALAQEVSWRWVFYLNLPFCGAGFVGDMSRVDWIGSVVFVGSVTAILIPVTWGGIMTLMPLIVGVFGVFGFVLYERMVPGNPMIRLEIFGNRTTLWGVLYYIPLYFQNVKGVSPIMTGVSIFPQSFTVAPTSVITAIIISKTGHFRWAIWAGWVLTTLGVGILALLDVYTLTVAWVFILIVPGIGTGLLFPSGAFALQAAASNENRAYTVSMFAFFWSFGQAFGIAIEGVTFQNSLKKQLDRVPEFAELADKYARDAVGLVKVPNEMQDGILKEKLRECYAEAFKVVWLGLIRFTAVGLLTSLGTKSLNLDRKLQSNHGLRGKKNGGVEEMG